MGKRIIGKHHVRGTIHPRARSTEFPMDEQLEVTVKKEKTTLVTIDEYDDPAAVHQETKGTKVSKALPVLFTCCPLRDFIEFERKGKV